MTRKLLIIIFFTIFNSVFAQHDHITGKSNNLSVLFSTQNDQYSAVVESDTDEFFKDSSYVIYLKLSSSSPIDSAGVKFRVMTYDSTQIEKQLLLLNDKYSAKIKFQREGKHVLEFTFNLTNDDRTVKNFSFSFNTNVKINNNNNNNNMHQNEGMMGMGSTSFWLIMGGIMVAMMAVIMLLNSNR